MHSFLSVMYPELELLVYKVGIYLTLGDSLAIILYIFIDIFVHESALCVCS
jgi:hypothetical protein